MADNVSLPGTGDTILADEYTDSDMGFGKAQYVKLIDGTPGASGKGVIDNDGLRISLDRPTNQSNVFQPIVSLLQRIIDALRLPDFVQLIISGRALRVYVDANSVMPSGTVTTVTTVTTCSTVTNVTNFNTIDSREVVWGAWKNGYLQGIRNKIV